MQIRMYDDNHFVIIYNLDCDDSDKTLKEFKKALIHVIDTLGSDSSEDALFEISRILGFKVTVIPEFKYKYEIYYDGEIEPKIG